MPAAISQFTADQFCTDLRAIGAQPSIYRREGTVYYSMKAAPPEATPRLLALHTWAHERDKGEGLRNAHLSAVVATKPEGDFFHHLGC